MPWRAWSATSAWVRPWANDSAARSRRAWRAARSRAERWRTCCLRRLVDMPRRSYTRRPTVTLRGGFTTVSGCGMIPRHGDLIDDPDHGRAARPRRGLGGHPAAAATQAAPSQGRSALDRGPGRARRHHLCAAGRGALAAAPGQGTGLWQRGDLLAAAAGLASRRRLGGLASPVAGLARR